MMHPEKTLPMKTLSREESLARTYVLVVYFFIAFVGILSLTLEKPVFSSLEKRALAPLPTLTVDGYFSGRYTRALSLHYADTFPFRDKILRYQHLYEDLKGFKYEDIQIYHAPPSAQGGEEDDDEPLDAIRPDPPLMVARTPEKMDPTATDAQGKEHHGGGDTDGKGALVPVPAPAAQKIERIENIVVVGSAAFYIYGGSSKTADRYAAVVNKAATVVGGKAKVFCLLAPTAIEFNLPSKYQAFTNSQRTIMKHVFGHLQNVTGVDVYNNLVSHRTQYLFFRTDHHWTALGAYYAYEDFAKSAGYTPTPLSSYKEIEIGKFWGTLYSSTRNSTLKENPDVVTAYKPAGTYKVTNYNEKGRSLGAGFLVYEKARNISDKYVAFLLGDYPYIAIINNGTPKRDKKLLVLKESFGNAFVPFLAPDYKEVHVGDIRNFPYGLSSFVTAHGIDEILIINNLFAVSDRARIRELQKIVEAE